MLWRRASLSIGAPFGEPGAGLIYQGLCEMDEGGSVDEASLLLKRLRRGAWGELLHWGPWNICQESIRMRACLSVGTAFQLRGTCYVGGLAYRGL
jgi:hypothetical protein